MASSKRISVLLIGVEQKERLLLKGIFQLSQSREREYYFVEDTRSDYEKFLYADIVIADKESLPSVQEWKKLSIQADEEFSAATVFLTRHKSETSKHIEIQKPLIALRVLNTLDGINITEKDTSIETAINTDSCTHTSEVVSYREISSNNNILVIDDSLPIRKHIEHELNKFNCSIDFAETAEDGLTLIKNNKYNLVFLDVVLPGMDGYELCKRIKRDKALRDTPIIMLTSKSSPFDKVRGSLAGCDNYLTKPVNINKFNKLVEKHLQTEEALQA